MPIGTVVLVPGFCGSILTRPWTPFSDVPKVNVWPNPQRLALGEWSWMALDPSGDRPQVSWYWNLEPGPPLPMYYGSLSDRLREAGWEVIGAALDWRRSLRLDGLRVAELIRRVGRDAPVNIICHSRGGLVTRWALELLRQTSDLGRVGRVAGLGVPHLGSWDAPAAVAGWAELLVLLGWVLYGVAVTAGTIPWAGYLGDVVRTWPGLYELMPSPAYPGLFPGQVEQIYSQSGWSAINVFPPQNWLSSALAGWATLPPPPPQVEWVDVRGHGLRTPQSMIPGQMCGGSVNLTYSGDGDGSVSLLSSNAPNRRSIYTPTAHNSLPYDGRVIDALKRYLLEGLSSDEEIEGPILY